ncbi:MAG: MerR family transcriptional regulator [Candidatus Kapaibacterium sp.]
MQKLYYSISEVSHIIDEEQHILRYWEKEFKVLKPRKNRGGNRIYNDKDIHILKIIKKLMRDDKMSLPGAKEKIITLLKLPPDQIDFDSASHNGLFPFEEKKKPKKNYNKSKKDGIHPLSETKQLKELLTEISDFLKGL